MSRAEEPRESADRRAFRELAAQLLDGDVHMLLHDLTNEIQTIAVLFARTRRGAPALNAGVDELESFEGAFGRSVSLTRKLRERLYTRNRLGELVSLTRVTKDLAAIIGPAMPEGIKLGVFVPEEASVVAGAATEVRRALVSLIAAAVDGIEAGTVNLEVRVDRDDANHLAGVLEIHVSPDPTARAYDRWSTAVAQARDLGAMSGAAVTLLPNGPAQGTTLGLRFPLVC